MNLPRRPWRLAAVAVAALLFAAACSTSDEPQVLTRESEPSDTSSSAGDSSSNDTESAPSADEPADEPATESDPAEPADTTQTMASSSPVGAFFEEGGGIDAALAEYRVRVEEKILVCMAAQGFEFAVSAPVVPEMDRLQSELTLRAWTEQFGYGIATDFESAATGRATDPNAEIFFSMSASEREVWTQTLAGDAGIQGALGGGTSVPLEEQGCIGEAIIETGGGEVIEGMQEFGDAYAEAEEALNDRREMIEVTDEWSRCLADIGYPDYAQRGDPEEDIGSRFQVIVAPLVQSLGSLDREQAQAFLEGDDVTLEDFPNLDVAALRALQAEEIKVALADLDCYEQHVKSTYEPLRDDLENGLLDTFGSELDALRTIGS